MNKKYEFTDETVEVYYHTLHRIKALIDIPEYGIEVGDLGGFIEKEENLSHKGKCWVRDNAKVYGKAQIYDCAWVFGNARVCGNTFISDNVQVFGNAFISDNAKVYGNATISGNAMIFDNAQVSGTACICSGLIGNDAFIKSNDDHFTILQIGSRYDSTTFFKCKDGHIHVKCGCFNGTIDEFETGVKKTHGVNKYAQEYNLAIQMAKLHINTNDIK